MYINQQNQQVQQHIQSRQILRLFLILVLGMSIFGGCYAYANWQPEPETLQLSTLTEEGDWIDLVSLLGEQAVQWFFEIYE